MPKKQAEIEKFQNLMESTDFWNDKEAAQKVINACNQLKEWTVPAESVKEKFEAVESLLPDAYALQETEMIAELENEVAIIEKQLEELEVRKMFSGELDNKNCFLTINSGAGGTEACDWVNMLSRMYQRWGARHSWQVEVLDFLEGDVAGYKSITIKLTGDFVYGFAKAEKGVHRLVRISPFDSNARRHTSFASVEVTPEITDDIQIDLRMDDVRIDTYRASGAGGQHVNKTDSAVRMTHIPSGIIVTSQSQRSQIQNREACIKLLSSKLYELEVTERERKLKEMAGEKRDNAWGSQIRNYVFQPYTLVKDTRTKYEEGNVIAVMDGEIDGFIYAYLKEFG